MRQCFTKLSRIINFQVSAETFESATVYFSAIDGFINLVAESTPLEVSSNRDP